MKVAVLLTVFVDAPNDATDEDLDTLAESVRAEAWQGLWHAREVRTTGWEVREVS